MKFSTTTYWNRRKKGFRGQTPGTEKEHSQEQRKLDAIARKLFIEKQRNKEANETKKEVIK